ncbi:putative phage head-tail adaptor [Escherichia coli]|nr:putative phage head-tail adaptor [Escherichia coli]
MAISAGRLTQMISVLNPVLTRNAAGEMTEEWVSCGKIHADIPGQEQPGADAVRCGNGAGGNPHLGTRSVWS